MPRFYINFQTGDQLAKDDEGIELPTLEAAWKAALKSARELIAENAKGNTKKPLQTVIVRGENGQDLLTIPVKHIPPEPPK